jgi:hypothetical protein
LITNSGLASRQGTGAVKFACLHLLVIHFGLYRDNKCQTQQQSTYQLS